MSPPRATVSVQHDDPDPKLAVEQVTLLRGGGESQGARLQDWDFNPSSMRPEEGSGDTHSNANGMPTLGRRKSPAQKLCGRRPCGYRTSYF